MKPTTLKRLLALMLACVMLFALCACGDTKDKDNDTPKEPVIGKDQINAVDYLVDNTGKVDETDKITEMHEKAAELGIPVYYPNGTYLFNGLTLNFDSGVKFESQDGVVIRNDVCPTSIINFDDDGNFIGLMHNHLEAKFTDEDFNETYQNGNLVSPPLANIDYETKVDFIPYWYNDFGRECTLSGGFGWKGWYDWQWNHHDIGATCTNKLPVEGEMVQNDKGEMVQKTEVCGAKMPKMDDPYTRAICPECGAESGYDQYDPDLHPLIGWYRGDDPVALDWISYWLQTYGMKQSILLSGNAGSEDSKSGSHWVYELLRSPNGKQMKYALQVASSSYGSDEPTIRNNWWETFNSFYFNAEHKDQVYCYTTADGKRYPAIFLWDEESVRYSVKDREIVIRMYKDAAAAFQENGFDGICVLARTAIFTNEGGAAARADMAAAGVQWFSCGYPNNCIGAGSTYGERVDRFLLNPDTSCIYGVSSGMNTHTPHPSAWNCGGHSPELFGKWVSKAVEATTSVAERPKMITCYNISEWSEGGPGLVPTVGQRFGYLEAIRDNIVVK